MSEKNRFYRQHCPFCHKEHAVMVEAFAPEQAHVEALKKLRGSVGYCGKKKSLFPAAFREESK